MAYYDWLSNELNIYKRENEILKEKYNGLEKMFNEVHDNELETREKKNNILKWAYSLDKENHILKSDLHYQMEHKAELFQEIKKLKMLFGI